MEILQDTFESIDVAGILAELEEFRAELPEDASAIIDTVIDIIYDHCEVI